MTCKNICIFMYLSCNLLCLYIYCYVALYIFMIVVWPNLKKKFLFETKLLPISVYMYIYISIYMYIYVLISINTSMYVGYV